MAFVWDLIQQVQLHNSKSKAKSAESAAKSAERKARTVESRLEGFDERLHDLERDVGEMRMMMAVLLDRLERRLGEDIDGDRIVGRPPLGRKRE